MCLFKLNILFEFLVKSFGNPPKHITFIVISFNAFQQSHHFYVYLSNFMKCICPNIKTNLFKSKIIFVF